MTSTKEIFITPAGNISEILQSRLQESRMLLSSLLWIVLLMVHFYLSLIGASIPGFFLAGLFDNYLLNLFINVVVIVSVLLFFHSQPSLLKGLPRRTKLLQILLS